MQRDERVGGAPVAAWQRTLIHKGDVGVAHLQQGIGEGLACGSGTNDQIVRTLLAHAVAPVS